MAELQSTHYQMYINGKFMDSASGDVETVIDPSTGKKLWTAPAATIEEARAAVDAAWAAKNLAARACSNAWCVLAQACYFSA